MTPQGLCTCPCSTASNSSPLLTTPLPGVHSHPCLGAGLLSRRLLRYLIRPTPGRVECVHVCMSRCTCGGQRTFQESFLTLHRVGPKGRTWVVWPICPTSTQSFALVPQDSYRRRQRAGHGRKDNWCPGAGRRSSSNRPSRTEVSRRSQVTWRHL